VALSIKPTVPEPTRRGRSRRRASWLRAAIPAAAVAIVLAGCTSGAGTTATATTTTQAAAASANSAASTAAGNPAGAAPNAPGAPGAPGDAPGGAAPGGASTGQYTASGAYSLSTGTETKSSASYNSTVDDKSAVLVTGSANPTLTDATITTSGATKSSDESSFYGLNAGLLAQSGGKVTLTGGSVTTTGTGANGIFASGTSVITASNLTIKATGQYAHGAMASGGGTVTLSNVTVSTAGGNSAAIATDRGGGTITVTGGSATTSGQDSPAIYSTGTITATGGTYTATGAEAAVIEGANSITLTDATLNTSKDRWGVMIFQSMSGNASGTKGTFTMTGGALSDPSTTGPLFYVTNSTGAISLKGVKVTAASGVLIKAATGKRGNSGSNGGTAVFTADGETLTGDLISDSSSSIAATLKNGTSLTGTINSAALTLDAGSSWTVTGTSNLTSFSDTSGVSGTTITNINGNGHTVYYDASLAANSALGGKTYSTA
jgi:hypothetical protein